MNSGNNKACTLIHYYNFTLSPLWVRLNLSWKYCVFLISGTTSFRRIQTISKQKWPNSWWGMLYWLATTTKRTASTTSLGTNRRNRNSNTSTEKKCHILNITGWENFSFCFVSGLSPAPTTDWIKSKWRFLGCCCTMFDKSQIRINPLRHWIFL